MKLSKRLEAILEWIDHQTIADIGCDHAKLACQAVLDGKADRAYACDIALGPLERAKETIQASGLQNQVIPLLRDGFEELPEDTELAIVAGMGAQTIINMLETHPISQTMLLSPHKDAWQLRRWLAEHGWAIERERLVHEGHFYPVMQVRPGAMELDEASCYYGFHPRLDQDYLDYLAFEKKRLEKLEKQLPAGLGRDLEKQKSLLNTRIQQIQQNYE